MSVQEVMSLTDSNLYTDQEHSKAEACGINQNKTVSLFKKRDPGQTVCFFNLLFALLDFIHMNLT